MTTATYTPSLTNPAVSIDRVRVALLAKWGYQLAVGDAEQGGWWLSRGYASQWFASSAAAVQAVERGWPKMPTVVRS